MRVYSNRDKEAAKTIQKIFRLVTIPRRRAPKKNLAQAVFSPARVRRMISKHGLNWFY